VRRFFASPPTKIGNAFLFFSTRTFPVNLLVL
jgi:hypothetical protein